MLRQSAEVVAAVPIFISSPLYRRWHLRWGATDEEVAEPMPGDELVPVAHFVVTRAITICAPPSAVWPWIMQVGFGRAGFYSYDLLDNLGRPSAEDLHMEWQQAHVGDLAAPMTNPPTTDTSFSVHDVKSTEYVVWSKPGSTWVWMLKPLDATRTRLVTRIRQRYVPRPATVVTIILSELRLRHDAEDAARHQTPGRAVPCAVRPGELRRADQPRARVGPTSVGG